MKQIKEIIEFINEEIEGAETYIDYAVENKGIDEQAFSIGLKLAQAEIEHAEIWHTLIMTKIEQQRAELKAKNIEIPPFMLEMWKDYHKDYVDKVARLKLKINTSK